MLPGMPEPQDSPLYSDVPHALSLLQSDALFPEDSGKFPHQSARSDVPVVSGADLRYPGGVTDDTPIWMSSYDMALYYPSSPGHRSIRLYRTLSGQILPALFPVSSGLH